ncbi:MAG: MBL fold metallo-hydrolase [Pseudomonadota bacterium]|nr:MBL fold metallo-hydrolase [Pseudomonadota bacterium]
MKSYCFTVIIFLLLLPAVVAVGGDVSSAGVRYPRVHFLNVGEGAATLIETGNNKHILIDCGNVITGARILDFCRRFGIKDLDALIITHPHADHMGGVFQLLPELNIKRVYDNGQPIPAVPQCDIFRWYAEAVRRLAFYEILRRGDQLIWPGVVIDVLSPTDTSGKNWNDNALVLRVKAGDSSLLLMADAGKRVEVALMTAKVDLRAEVLQVGHHGAADASSPAFLRAVSPRLAVISVNKDNVRGYPAPETIARLQRLGIKTILTYQDGDFVWSCR